MSRGSKDTDGPAGGGVRACAGGGGPLGDHRPVPGREGRTRAAPLPGPARAAQGRNQEKPSFPAFQPHGPGRCRIHPGVFTKVERREEEEEREQTWK